MMLRCIRLMFERRGDIREGRFLNHESAKADIHSASQGRGSSALLKALGGTSPCFVGGPFSSSSPTHKFCVGDGAGRILCWREVDDRQRKRMFLLARRQLFQVGLPMKSLCRVYKGASSHSSVSTIALRVAVTTSAACMEPSKVATWPGSRDIKSNACKL
jgi:hypothetical protein